MATKEKLIDKLYSRPKDFTWSEALRLFDYFGFTEVKQGHSGGSRRRFVNKHKITICLHEPHPDYLLRPDQIKHIIERIGRVNNKKYTLKGPD